MLLRAQNTTPSGVFACGPLMSDLARFGVVFAPETGDGSGGFEEAPQRDEQDDGPLDERGAEDAFLKTLTGADEATDGQVEGGKEPDAKTGASDPSQEGQQEPADQPAETAKNDAKTPAGDDAIVEVKVGDETHKVPVKDLKRLFGQEAALTRRSQEVAAERAAVVQDAERARAVVSKALERAEARAKPYAEMDFWKLSRELDPGTFEQLRKDAREALDEVKFLREEDAAAAETITRHQKASVAAAAQACVQALSDPKSPHHVADWSPKLYGELVDFARAQGFAAAGNITDPAAIKLLRMAMLYERGRTLVREKVTKVAEQPRKPLRPGTSGGPTPQQRDANTAVARLRQSGRAEDAEAAFLSRLRRDDD